ncbi:SRPBCC family protein [Paraburkholderia sediminicola]|uniref:SRPBCC family protein n=1 Tax=Paraburkholderia sediminicola TaxID=458836 RepID=UPI0038BD7B50
MNPSSDSSTDRIEKQILLKAPRSRVWRAVSNAEEFGKWFRVDFNGKQFVAGQSVQGNITYPGYEHLVMDVLVERVEPEHHLSFRWHPAAVDISIDYSPEPTTLVVFELTEVDSGTLLRVIESGFDRIPAARRKEAFRLNSGGWERQLVNVEKYVAER